MVVWWAGVVPTFRITKSRMFIPARLGSINTTTYGLVCSCQDALGVLELTDGHPHTE